MNEACANISENQAPVKHGGRFRDLTNQRFGRLLVVRFFGTGPNGNAMWECLCDCGNVTTRLGVCLTRGKESSCGCLQRERVAARNYKHGHTTGATTSRTWSAWKHMRERCNDPSNINYGGRGITVCSRWDDFENFLADMGECPPGLTIDRIASNGNYEAGNCRWADWPTQANNKRTNLVLLFNGKEQSLTMWCKELNRNYYTMQQRLWKGWSTERALSTPTNGPFSPRSSRSNHDSV